MVFPSFFGARLVLWGWGKSWAFVYYQHVRVEFAIGEEAGELVVRRYVVRRLGRLR
jgi:hypothetical protein